MTHTPIPNCPQEDKPLRERAWADGQRPEPKYSDAEIEAMCVCLNNLERRGESFRVTPSEFRHLHDMLHSLLTERDDSRPCMTDKAEVSDADVDAACRAYIAADRFLLDGAVESMREPMRAALADLSRDVRELATEVIEAINDGDAQSARNAAQAALDKYTHQEPRA